MDYNILVSSSPPLDKKKGIRKSRKTKFKDIPKDVLKKIVAQLASKSFIDFMNAKQTSKEFLEVANDKYVLQHVNVREFEPISWFHNEKAIKFLNSCKECENPEALFKLGMVEFFNERKVESGLQLLKKAAKKGHVGAIYVSGIILICYGGQLKEEGIGLLSTCKSLRSRLVECRKDAKQIISNIWINNYIESSRNDQKEATCNCNGGRRSTAWNMDDHVDPNSLCDGCLWNLEARKFCNMLRT
ncbi:hypothetical protein Tsubulata_016858, partial [Turnera subulata]